MLQQNGQGPQHHQVSILFVLLCPVHAVGHEVCHHLVVACYQLNQGFVTRVELGARHREIGLVDAALEQGGHLSAGSDGSVVELHVRQDGLRVLVVVQGGVLCAGHASGSR
jgi:hypothetical protein